MLFLFFLNKKIKKDDSCVSNLESRKHSHFESITTTLQNHHQNFYLITYKLIIITTSIPTLLMSNPGMTLDKGPHVLLKWKTTALCFLPVIHRGTPSLNLALGD